LEIWQWDDYDAADNGSDAKEGSGKVSAVVSIADCSARQRTCARRVPAGCVAGGVLFVVVFAES